METINYKNNNLQAYLMGSNPHPGISLFNDTEINTII